MCLPLLHLARPLAELAHFTPPNKQTAASCSKSLARWLPGTDQHPIPLSPRPRMPGVARRGRRGRRVAFRQRERNEARTSPPAQSSATRGPEMPVLQDMAPATHEVAVTHVAAMAAYLEHPFWVPWRSLSSRPGSPARTPHRHGALRKTWRGRK